MIAQSRMIRVTPQINRQSPQATGLIAAWPLNDGGGRVARDMVGKNHGTLSGGPAWTTGKNGKALAFDGVNDVIAIENPNLGGTFTISAWVNVLSYASATDQLPIFGEFLPGNASSKNYLLINKSTQTLVFDQYPPSGGQAVSSRAISVGKWYFVAISQLATNSRNLFVNAVQDGTSSEAYSGLSPVVWSIGAREDQSYYFKGAIADVRIYNRALSAAEVQQIYLRPWELYAPPRSLMYAASIEEAYNIWMAGQQARQVWYGGHRAQQIWSMGHRIA